MNQGRNILCLLIASTLIVLKRKSMYFLWQMLLLQIQ
ncbi:hypothetical protein Ab1vBOLIVR2_gp35 [Agrobacterium phage OLIVR2]|uniref:Uncharacterized protein n=1 Tax=Agrobacterium phage OLIVR1 TaxID=2723769 RepID=A0A858MU19_9CAUD|nr:hypothetical protein KNU98_gp074 [Agrobacterium phage OLIVR1]QIW87230.1 hypothetical protein Ab1vBOLIVR1_gp35 [Agrobacterium phage OLIVR1]QIW87338.1 hypothetical protein Ab1vBOLIVR2_gp35 [Agrobacterium phage OLIVR2]QIW87445.1 hypothetical protein Ab1vBOLIVR3_gp35 [Agrobacterium phage OLIVR3]